MNVDVGLYFTSSFSLSSYSGAKVFMDIEEEREMAEKDAKLQKTDVGP